LVAVVGVTLAAQERDEARFTASPSELVVLSVVVSDRRGRDVPDLERERKRKEDVNVKIRNY